jgi:hypothetical protein
MPAFLTSQNLPNYASDPSSPADGDAYFNTTTNSVRIYVNSTALSASRWIDLAGYQVETFTAGSYTWTRPSNVTHLKFVYAIGAGGGGQNGELQTNFGSSVVVSANGASGGGAGAVVRVDNLYIGQNSTISVSVATGQTGATAKTFSKSPGSTTISTQGYSASTAPYSATTFGSYVSAGSGNDYEGGTAVTPYVGAGKKDGAIGGGYGGTIDYIPGDPGYTNIGGNRDAASLAQSGFNQTAPIVSIVSGSSTGITLSSASTAPASASGIPAGSGGGSSQSAAGVSAGVACYEGGQGGSGGGGTGGSGGGIAIGATGATSGVSLNITAGKGSDGNIGCGGGASGSACLAAPTAQYTGLTISMTVPAGGNGGDGRIYIAYVA